jgi:hypothetical protein
MFTIQHFQSITGFLAKPGMTPGVAFKNPGERNFSLDKFARKIY